MNHKARPSRANGTKGDTQLNSLTDDKNSRFAARSYKDSLTSDSAGWRSLHLRIREWAPCVDSVEMPTFGDPGICLLLNRSFPVDLFSEGRWRGIQYTRGTGVLYPAKHPRLFRYHCKDQKPLTIAAFILPQHIIDFVAEEIRKPGITLNRSLNYIPFLDDPHISGLCFSVLTALQGGAPDFYAQASAQWLASHLLLGPSTGLEWHQTLSREHISDYRLVRVLEYIDAHLSDRLDLRVLAKEAGISSFHFAALFAKAVGATPHRHVQHLRMQAAKAMLRDTDKTTLDIALSCGFGSASHFAVAFRRQFLQSPTEFRSSLRGFRLVHDRKLESDGH
jgi:AraC family transcriptional regulator